MAFLLSSCFIIYQRFPSLTFNQNRGLFSYMFFKVLFFLFLSPYLTIRCQVCFNCSFSLLFFFKSVWTISFRIPLSYLSKIL